MLRVMFRLALAGSLLVVAPSCGGSQAISKATKRDPDQKQAKQRAAEAHDQAAAGKVDEADRSYGEAYALASDAPNVAWPILVDWVEFLNNAGRHGRACDVAKLYYDSNPSEIKGYQLYADALLRGGRAQQALDVATQLVQLNDEDPSGHNRRGRALMLLERNEDAADELRKAVQLDESNARYHMALGEALLRMKEINKAALSFRSALKHAPDDPEAHVLLGVALREQSELDESKIFLDKAIELDPKNGRAYFELGRLYSLQYKAADAEEAFAKAVKFSPNDSQFWYAYGEIHRVQDRLDQAIAAYRKATDLDPPYPKAVTKLGATLVDTKQYDDAEVVLTQAIRREPKNAANYWHLARAYAAKRKTRAAIDNYETFIRLAAKNDPDRERARELINQLKRR